MACSRLQVALLVVGGIGLWFAAGCTAEKGKTETKETNTAAPAQEPQYEELKFVPDPSLLGVALENKELGIRIAPPRGWVSMHPDSLVKLQAQYDRMRSPDNPFVARPTRIFFEENQRLFMFVSELPNWPLPMSPMTAMSMYLQRVVEATPDVQITSGFFRSGNVKGYRILLMNEVMVNFRVLVLREGRAPIQINYLIPRGTYPVLQKAIEASVGSIGYL